ncbi:hypothetical protein K3495_g12209 [Podosphaera aphanis]|nr:hypothetical protein K3495_g12209 [Podosphaera aphanis]
MGIPGSELADKLAAEAACQPALTAASLAGVRAKIQQQIWDLTTAWWRSHAPSTYFYRTTPTAALPRESGLRPSEIAFDGRAAAATVRLCRLDP